MQVAVTNSCNKFFTKQNKIHSRKIRDKDHNPLTTRQRFREREGVSMKKPVTKTSSNENVIHAIPHSQLKVSGLNPRKHKRDEKALLELADNILENGVLQNLTARPNGNEYEIVFGEGRYLAVALLIKAKRVPKDYPMPVSVKDLTDLELLELATSENIQRADMHPLDEANAFQAMVQLGGDVASIAIKMGLSQKTVLQRLTIANKLIPQVKEALLENKVTLAQVQQLTAASAETQADVLAHIVNDMWGRWSAEDIKKFLKDIHMPVSNAIFKKALYQGDYSNNLFDDSKQSYFLDSAQAKRLQLEAIEERRQRLSESWAWVEVIKHDDFHAWEYEQGEGADPSKQGTLIIYEADTMKVHVKEGVVKRGNRVSGSSTTSTAKKPTPPYTKALIMETHHIKTVALQTELSKHHRTCLILNIMGLLGCGDVKLRTERPHWKNFKTGRLEHLSAPHAKALITMYGQDKVEVYPLHVHVYNQDVTKLYDYLKKLKIDKLQELFDVLTASLFGTWYDFDPLPGDKPLPLAVAKDLKVDMKAHFTLNEDFLKGYRRKGLLDLLKDLGKTQDYSSVQAKGMRDVILKETKGRDYLPQLVTFFETTTTRDLEVEEEKALALDGDDEALDAA
jgi:ParB family transcriptional regulator, chromosome partitioning protein